MGDGCRGGWQKEAGRYSGAEAWLDGSKGRGGDQLRIKNYELPLRSRGSLARSAWHFAIDLAFARRLAGLGSALGY